MATTATGRPALRASPTSAATSVDLARARRTGDADQVRRGRPADRARAARPRRRTSGSRPRSAAEPALGGRRRVRAPRGRAPRRAVTLRRATGRWRGCSRRPRAMVVPGPKTRATPALLRAAMSSSGMMPPAVTSTSSSPSALRPAVISRQQRHVRAGQDRQPDHVDVLLERSGDDHLRRLAQAGVDDLEALVAQAAREHLRATVVAVEAGLGDEHLDRADGHGRDCRLRPRRLGDRVATLPSDGSGWVRRVPPRVVASRA